MLCRKVTFNQEVKQDREAHVDTAESLFHKGRDDLTLVCAGHDTTCLFSSIIPFPADIFQLLAF